MWREADPCGLGSRHNAHSRLTLLLVQVTRRRETNVKLKFMKLEQMLLQFSQQGKVLAGSNLNNPYRLGPGIS
ncbi:hypothetical protein RHMOL_Rhmol04G0243500 [Rhododendron molle]|uniref:Uncharacterized protein n=1 Tax=Rhododendron molle TaxID=49168 RepID=A0ACC0P6D5_RHOML|nr:hypothetical protein RHMOL_Rhmol04G0243500 [Rhododendron molle]